MELKEKIYDYGEVPVEAPAEMEDYFFYMSKSKKRVFFESVIYDYNAAALPIFTGDKNAAENVGKRYNFTKNEFMSISPARIPGNMSNKILQSFDEKIFSAILRFAEYQKNAVVITDFLTLAKAAGVDYRSQIKRIRDSIERLSGCSLVFSNVLCNSDTKSAEVNLLSDAKIITVENWSDFANITGFSEKDQKRIVELVADRTKLRTILILHVCDLFFRNIQQKKYLTFDKKTLFSLTFTARRLLLLLKQQQIAENKHQFSCAFIASRIPLSWTPTSIGIGIEHIENAAEMLKNKGLIADYNLILQKPKKNSYIDFTFTDGD